MKKIIVWGIGKLSNLVFECLNLNTCKIVGIIDIDQKKQKQLWKNFYRVYSPKEIEKIEYDYIVVTTLQIETIQCQIKGKKIENEQVIFFWHQDTTPFVFINSDKKRVFELERELEIYKRRVANAPYEYGIYGGPIIQPAQELLKLIKDTGKSLCRFGDGEFEMILGNRRLWYQNINSELAERVKMILNSNRENIIIAIADNYGNLDKYTDEAADAIRAYLSPEKRKQHMLLLNPSKVYYDAYVSRPYMMYKDKQNAKDIFELYAEIIKDRNILMVEGQYTRTGYKNQLFEGAKSIKRILCPDQDAYSVYEKIYNAVIQYADKNSLIFITLGPTATVLAYDLAIAGYQAIDFGQLDNEYEWYKKQCKEREIIPGKSVSEIRWYKYPQENEPMESEFVSQVLCKIG